MRIIRRFTGRRHCWTPPTTRLYEPSSFISRAQISRVFALDQKDAPKDKAPHLTACFTGHRYLADRDVPEIKERLNQLLRMCYARGYRRFLCGGALGFDMLAAECVMSLQCEHDEVELVFVLPCSNQVRPWNGRQARRYERLLYAASEIVVLSGDYYDGCMQARNRHMVDDSQLCICYLRHAKGGTSSTVAYALKQGVPVMNTAMADVCAAFPDSGAV